MSVASVYDFENVIATAVAAVFTNAKFTALTQLSEPDEQKPRPRVEVIFEVSGQQTMGPRAILADGSPRIAGYKGQLLLHCITDASTAGKNTHGAYRAAVRNFCTGLPALLNGTALTQHKINLMVEGPTRHGFSPEKGYEGSTLQYAVDFSIQADAWVTLNGTS